MNRFDVVKAENKPGLVFSLINMVTKEPKTAVVSVGDKLSILYAETRDLILEIGPRDSMIHRGQVIRVCPSVTRCRRTNQPIFTITLDCSTEFESKVVVLRSDKILDINPINYVYEPDNPEEIKALELILTTTKDKEVDDVYSKHVIGEDSLVLS